MYVMFGYAREHGALSSIEVLDKGDKFWTFMDIEGLKPRCYPAVCPIGANKLILIGGHSNFECIIADISLVNLTEKKSTDMTGLSTPKLYCTS